jgi:hypothetical protein
MRLSRATRRACKRKVRYDSRTAAREAERLGLMPYRCSVCRWWHLTKRPLGPTNS